jgi:8-oxo-dGTP pyrophosphatase MutT (NUDIX family)
VTEPSATASLVADYVPLWIAGAIRGRVRRDLLPLLRDCPEIESAELGVRLRDAGGSRPVRSRRLQALAQRLRARGWIADWRNELCAVLDENGAELARCERGLFRTLGLQNRAVHINGYRSDGRLWIARRSRQKRADPGMLDNLAAGGVGAGESLRRTAMRELWEEAGVPAALARRVDFPGMVIRSLRETRYGVHDELVIVADILLPDGFEPSGRDGEVQEFMCLPTEAALATREWLQRRHR